VVVQLLGRSVVCHDCGSAAMAGGRASGRTS